MKHMSSEVSGIARVLFSNRKTPPEASCDGGVKCEQCAVPLMEQIYYFVERGEPVSLVLPSFPFKMPGVHKTFGSPLPDKAEELSLTHLASINDQVKQFYSPGLRFTLASDGRIILPVWQCWWPTLSLEGIQVYNVGLEKLVSRVGNSDCIRLYQTLEKVYSGLPYMEQLGSFYRDYAEPLETVRARTKQQGAAAIAFQGNFAYFYHDGQQSQVKTGMPAETVKKRSVEAAYRAVQNSDALTRLLHAQLPHSIRLSVHPQPAHGSKLGFYMLPTREAWRTPWHCVALFEQETGVWKFPEHNLALQAGAKVVYENSYPAYCVLEHNTLSVARR